MMKILFIILSSLFSLFSFGQFSEDGDYSFTDGKLYSLDIQICEDGESVCMFNFKHDENSINFSESGEWFRVNLNGVPENYTGPVGWYQIYYEDITYEFENLPNGKFKLTKGDDTYILNEKR
jgi:hypothetical protein